LNSLYEITCEEDLLESKNLVRKLAQRFQSISLIWSARSNQRSCPPYSSGGTASSDSFPC